MKLSIILFLLIAFDISAQAQQNYDVSLIPKDLLPYASAVVRDEQVTVEVNDPDNTIYHIKEAITVLNKNGDNRAHIIVWYNKNRVIKYIKGTVFNSFGIPTAKFSEKDFEDVYAWDGISLFDDIRVKHFQPPATGYPYTVEYEYEIRSKQSLDLDGWQPNTGTGVAVEKSTFSFTGKPGFNIRYKEFNLPSGVTTSTDKNGAKTYTWQVANLKAVRYEPFSPNDENYLSEVKIAPESFEDEGIKGLFTNWNELGKWIYDKLLVSQQDLPPETVQFVQQLTAGITDPKLKAKKIYEYMQGKTHYISVQVGIGGLQPFKASDVDRLNYGDCKALVNYTQALLKAVGINSWYCVVESGDKKVNMLSDFASIDQGDHIILCIPFKNDTTWADCTSQTIPFGYLGSFTDDRTVLACTPRGGILLHTPKYTTSDNLEKRKASFNISETGDLSGDMTTRFSGIDYDDRDDIIAESQKDRLKDVPDLYPSINNMYIEKLEYDQYKSAQPVTTENITLKASEFASIGDGKVYFMLNPVNKITHTPLEVMGRLNAMYINDGYTEEDEIDYTLPAGYRLYNSPLQINVKKPFGSFTVSMSINGNQLIYKRKFQLIDGTYPRDSYQDLVDLFQSAVDADAYTVTLIKNN